MRKKFIISSVIPILDCTSLYLVNVDARSFEIIEFNFSHSNKPELEGMAGCTFNNWS